jgi:putative heme-binding domain-containing protein
VAAVQRVFGMAARPSSAEKEKEVARVKGVVASSGGDPRAGKVIFAARCAVCHTLFGEGAKVGPDLTPYDRKNVEFLAVSIVDPSAAIREEYTNFLVETADDQTVIGLVAERGPDSITIVDATQQKTVVPKKEIKEERALGLSMMPEGLLAGLSDGELRDFFAYLRAERAVK